MEAGTKIRKDSNDSSVLAKYAIQEVIRKRENSEKNQQGNVYLFQSLKHPSEAKLLSETYGFGYYQIGVYSDETKRILYLKIWE